MSEELIAALPEDARVAGPLLSDLQDDGEQPDGSFTGIAGDTLEPGKRLRVQREKEKLTQAQLADRLGTDAETVSRMERGEEPLSESALAFNQATLSDRQRRRLKETTKEAGRDSEPRKPGPGYATPPPRSYDPDLERALLNLFAGETFYVPRKNEQGEIVQQEATIPGVAQVVGMFDEFDGMVIGAYAPGMARAWAQLAAENDAVHKMLTFVTYGGAWRGVMVATAPPLLAIAAHHGALPVGRFGPAEEPEQVEET